MKRDPYDDQTFTVSKVETVTMDKVVCHCSFIRGKPLMSIQATAMCNTRAARRGRRKLMDQFLFSVIQQLPYKRNRTPTPFRAPSRAPDSVSLPGSGVPSSNKYLVLCPVLRMTSTSRADNGASRPIRTGSTFCCHAVSFVSNGQLPANTPGSVRFSHSPSVGQPVSVIFFGGTGRSWPVQTAVQTAA
jgi:hypothetical protein